MREADEATTGEGAPSDPLKREHRCTSCYLRGEPVYMLPVRCFGVSTPAEFYPKYVAQGCWTRCLRCQREVGAEVPAPSQTQAGTSRSAQQDPSRSSEVCRICSENFPDLESCVDAHRCSACMQEFDVCRAVATENTDEPSATSGNEAHLQCV